MYIFPPKKICLPILFSCTQKQIWCSHSKLQWIRQNVKFV